MNGVVQRRAWQSAASIMLAVLLAGCGSSGASSTPTSTAIPVVVTNTATKPPHTVVVVVTATLQPTATPNVKATEAAKRHAKARATAAARRHARATATAKTILTLVVHDRRARATATAAARTATATATKGRARARATRVAVRHARATATALSAQKARTTATARAARSVSARAAATAAALHQAHAQATATAATLRHARAQATAAALRRAHARATAVTRRQARATATALARRKATPTPQPRPTVTPTKAPSGPHLGAITHTAAEIHTIQTGATAAVPAYAYYLNPVTVAARSLPRYGFLGTFQIFPKITVVVSYRGKKYDVVVAQPSGFTAGGIWVVTRIFRHGFGSSSGTPLPAQPHLGVVTHSATELSQIQAGVNARNPSYLYYLNPIQVVYRNLAHYGFTGAFSVIPKLTVIVYYHGTQYDVVLTQPAIHSAGGVWLIARISRHG